MVARYQSGGSPPDDADGFNRLSYVSSTGYGTLTESVVRPSIISRDISSSEEDVTQEILATSTEHINIDMMEDEEEEVVIAQEPLKTLVSGLVLVTGFLASTVSLVLTHERVPDTPPLPDLVLSSVETQSWGLDWSEIMLMSNVFTAVIVVILHNHRLIILRHNIRVNVAKH